MHQARICLRAYGDKCRNTWMSPYIPVLTGRGPDILRDPWKLLRSEIT